MNEVEARLAQLLNNFQSVALKDDNVVGQLLRKLGDVQARVDSTNGSIDQESFSQLQSEMAGLNLDEATKSELMSAIGKVDNGGSAANPAVQFVEDIFGRLRNLQSSITGSNVDANAVFAELSRNFEQVRSQIEPYLNSVNLNGSTVLSTVQKLIGNQLR